MSSPVISNIKQLEKGLFEDAHKQNMTFGTYIDFLGANGQISEEIYRPGVVDAQGQEVSVLRQMMKSAGIRTVGKSAQTVSEGFFTDPYKRILFPEYLSSRFRDLEKDSLNEFTFEDLITTRQPISSGAYRYPVIDKIKDNEVTPGKRSEGSNFGVYEINSSEHAITLQQYGGIIKITYQVMARLAIPLLDRFLGRVARESRRRKTRTALEVLVQGDGNSNGMPDTAIAGSVWTLNDLIDLVMEAGDRGADPRMFLADRIEIQNLLKLDFVSNFQSYALAASFIDTGQWPRILGLMMKRPPKGSILDGSRKVIAFDPTMGLEMIYEPALELFESDKLIDTQFERIVISESNGFAKPDVDTAISMTRSP